MSDYLDLLDYRRRVGEMYRRVRENGAAYEQFRQQRDSLFKTHPQSALDAEQKAVFAGLSYYDYDLTFRVVAQVDKNVESEIFHVELGDDGHFSYQRFAQVKFDLPTGSGRLSLFWILGYGGGLFLPFGDTTNKGTTYGGGRYLYDTIKGADLGAGESEIVLDFNYAYNPSCAYNPRWVCPLSPSENKLSFSVTTGELMFF
jgi:uncharacterized protein